MRLHLPSTVDDVWALEPEPFRALLLVVTAFVERNHGLRNLRPVDPAPLGIRAETVTRLSNLGYLVPGPGGVSPSRSLLADDREKDQASQRSSRQRKISQPEISSVRCQTDNSKSETYQMVDPSVVRLTRNGPQEGSARCQTDKPIPQSSSLLSQPETPEIVGKDFALSSSLSSLLLRGDERGGGNEEGSASPPSRNESPPAPRRRKSGGGSASLFGPSPAAGRLLALWASIGEPFSLVPDQEVVAERIASLCERSDPAFVSEKIAVWWTGNPAKRPKKNTRRFIVGWFLRDEEKARGAAEDRAADAKNGWNHIWDQQTPERK
jgi:hypothetical protein